MANKIKTLLKINKLIFSAAFNEPTDATLNITDKEVSLASNGKFRSLKINFTGNVFIYNELTDGYYIRVTKNTINIYNIIGKNLNNDNVLFRFEGDCNIKKAEFRSFTGNKFFCTLNNVDSQILINRSKTNVDDETLLFLEEEIGEDITNTLRRNKVDDNSIKGLSTQRPFANGYVGYYHYHPDKKVFGTGKSLTNESRPISKLGDYREPSLIKRQVNALSQMHIKQLESKNLIQLKVEKIPDKIKNEKPKEFERRIEAKTRKEDKKGGDY